jgi:hypothetical protein
MSDYKCQLSAIEGMKMVIGDKFVDPREHTGSNGEQGKFVSKKKGESTRHTQEFLGNPSLIARV